MSTCMNALCRHVKQNKSQGGGGNRGEGGGRGERSSTCFALTMLCQRGRACLKLTRYCAPWHRRLASEWHWQQNHKCTSEENRKCTSEANHKCTSECSPGEILRVAQRACVWRKRHWPTQVGGSRKRYACTATPELATWCHWHHGFLCTGIRSGVAWFNKTNPRSMAIYWSNTFKYQWQTTINHGILVGVPIFSWDFPPKSPRSPPTDFACPSEPGMALATMDSVAQRNSGVKHGYGKSYIHMVVIYIYIIHI